MRGSGSRRPVWGTAEPFPSALGSDGERQASSLLRAADVDCGTATAANVSTGGIMRKHTEGRYRTEAPANRVARAYVIDGRKAFFVTDEVYRAREFEPPFETLPTEDQYQS